MEANFSNNVDYCAVNKKPVKTSKWWPTTLLYEFKKNGIPVTRWSPLLKLSRPTLL